MALGTSGDHAVHGWTRRDLRQTFGHDTQQGLCAHKGLHKHHAVQHVSQVQDLAQRLHLHP